MALETPKIFSSNQTVIFGYTGYSHHLKGIVVVFRASVNLMNWLTDINFALTNHSACDGCQVHLGFYNGYKSVVSNLRKYIDELLSVYKDTKIFITGHSLGAALSILTAADMQKYNLNINVYNFGQPRVGNNVFAGWYESQKNIKTYRVIYYADLFVRLPPI